MTDAGRDLIVSLAELAAVLPAATGHFVADQVRASRPQNWPGMLGFVADRIHPADRRAAVVAVLRQWLHAKPPLAPAEFAAALTAAVATAEHYRAAFSLELAWTGPNSGVIPVRHTEQVLLELIGEAKRSVSFISYAVCRIARVRAALAEAAGRGVPVRGIVDGDLVADPDAYNPLIALGSAVTESAELYYWPMEKRPPNADGKRGIVHAKCVVADGSRMFISSANLTEQAFTLNMELGVLVSGTTAPANVDAHFDALIRTGVLVPVPRAFSAGNASA